MSKGNPTIQLAILLGSCLAVIVITHWPTFVYASRIDADEYEKVGKGAISLMGVVGAIYAAWARNLRS